MTRSLFSLATLAILLVFTSAYYSTPSDSRVGYFAPSLTLTTAEGTQSLSQLRGNYVIVTFWSSIQPESRIDNMQQAHAARLSGMKHVSVNMDESEAMYSQLVSVDHLHSSMQWHCDSASQEEVRRIWRQESGFCSFLIDPDGRIIKKNPTPQDLAQR